MIKGVIFDFDNTLYNYDIANKFALETMINYISIKFNIKSTTVENTYNKINKQIKNSNNPNNKFNKTIYFKSLFEILNISLRYLNDCISLYNSKFIEKFKLYDGVIEAFQLLKSNNIKIGILSNNIFFQQYVKLLDMKLIEYIDIMQTSDECGEEKPNIFMFLSIQNKMQIPFGNLAYIGDNYEHDIEPALEVGIFPFWFNEINEFKVIDKIICFNSFIRLTSFFDEYFKTADELIFLSKYFGQSVLNVQGPGGNISIKLDDLLLIKSSGCILGNISYTDGYCIVDKNECDKMVKTNQNKIVEAKIFGNRVPSMETYFHSFMKKYTIHLHFTPSNIYFCSNNIIKMEDFHYNNIIIEFYNPGIDLAREILNLYDSSCDIYFLKNHGLIITADSIDEVLNYYDYIFDWFNTKLKNIYDCEKIPFLLNQVYYKNKYSVIIKQIDVPIEIFKNIKNCFPDMIVFIKNQIEIDNLKQFSKNFIYCDVILYNNAVYCICDNITKLYSLIEIVDSYKTIYLQNNGCLSLIENISQIQNMPEEKYRNSL
jgi:putative hydrolase of the HAD superfamily